MRLRCTVFFVLAALAAIALVAHAQAPRLAAEQRLFSDGAIRRPVNLSPEVLKILLATEQVRGQFSAMASSDTENPAQFFLAAEVHLSEPGEVDLVVIGVGRMNGADNSWFWIVRSARKNPKVVLFSAATTLSVLNTKTNGYRDVGSAWSSPAGITDTTIYHFDGSAYQVWKH